MTVEIIRKKLHQLVDTMEDKKAIAIYNLLEQYMDTDAARKQLIFAEREKVLNGESKTYKWGDVKRMAKNKKLRNEL